MISASILVYRLKSHNFKIRAYIFLTFENLMLIDFGDALDVELNQRQLQLLSERIWKCRLYLLSNNDHNQFWEVIFIFSLMRLFLQNWYLSKLKTPLYLIKMHEGMLRLQALRRWLLLDSHPLFRLVTVGKCLHKTAIKLTLAQLK